MNPKRLRLTKQNRANLECVVPFFGSGFQVLLVGDQALGFAVGIWIFAIPIVEDSRIFLQYRNFTLQNQAQLYAPSRYMGMGTYDRP